MSNVYKVQFEVRSRDPMQPEQLEKLFSRLIDIGLEDASDTIESGEGDLQNAKLATELTICAPRIVQT